MTAEIVTVFAILGISVVFLVTEWIPMEVTALLTLGATALFDFTAVMAMLPLFWPFN